MARLGGSRIAAVNLVVPQSLLPSVATYYENLFGMTEVKDVPWAADAAFEGKQRKSFVFPGSLESCGVTFLTSPAVTQMRTAARDDIFWKIGLALEDVDRSGAAYAAQGGAWNGGNQFLDVGYLGHTQDPAGFTIEFLQTTFEDSREARRRRTEAAGTGGPLGQKQDPVIGQITTRTGNAQASLDFYTQTLGMKLLCIEPVTQYGFDLYFLAFTDDEPPNPHDLKAVENREWLYQRPYTTLEIQACAEGGCIKGTELDNNSGGFDSVSLCLDDSTFDRLRPSFLERGYLVDPDGLKLRVSKC